MICFPLYKQGIKSVYKTMIIFMVILSMYISVMISMFDPKLGSALEEFSKTMPELMAMIGMNSSTGELTQFLSNYLYGLLMLVFPMIATAIVANSLIAKHVDKGSMAYLLAAPHTRKRVVLTQLSVLLTCIFSLIIFCTALGIAVSEILFPGELNIANYLLLNLGVLLLHFAIAGLCFFASCISNETRLCMSIGIGFPLISILLQMLSNMGGKLENLKYATFFSLFQPEAILAQESNALICLAILFAVGVILCIAGTVNFCKRDIPV